MQGCVCSDLSSVVIVTHGKSGVHYTCQTPEVANCLHQHPLTWSWWERLTLLNYIFCCFIDFLAFIKVCVPVKLRIRTYRDAIFILFKLVIPKVDSSGLLFLWGQIMSSWSFLRCLASWYCAKTLLRHRKKRFLPTYLHSHPQSLLSSWMPLMPSISGPAAIYSGMPTWGKMSEAQDGEG